MTLAWPGDRPIFLVGGNADAIAAEAKATTREFDEDMAKLTDEPIGGD